MDALQPPRPLDKKTTFYLTRRIFPLSRSLADDAEAAALSCCFFLFYSSPFVFFSLSFGMHGNIKEPFVPPQCCGHKSHRDLFFLLFLIPSRQTEVTSAPSTRF